MSVRHGGWRRVQQRSRPEVLPGGLATMVSLASSYLTCTDCQLSAPRLLQPDSPRALWVDSHRLMAQYHTAIVERDRRASSAVVTHCGNQHGSTGTRAPVEAVLLPNSLAINVSLITEGTTCVHKQSGYETQTHQGCYWPAVCELDGSCARCCLRVALSFDESLAYNIRFDQHVNFPEKTKHLQMTFTDSFGIDDLPGGQTSIHSGPLCFQLLQAYHYVTHRNVECC